MANASVGTRAQSAGLVIIDTFQCQISFSSKERHNLSGSKFFEINVRGHIPRLQPNGVSRSRGLAHARKPAASRAFGYSGLGISGRRWGAPRTLPDGFGHCPAAASQRCRRAGIFGGDSRSPRRGGSAAARLCAACRDRSSRCRPCPPRTSRRVLERLEALKRARRPRSSGEATQRSNQSMFGRNCLADARDGAMRGRTRIPSPLRIIPKLRPSRSPLSVATLYATLENTRSPGAGRPIGGRAEWGRPGRSAHWRSRLCPHTVIIPQIGTNTCGWTANSPETPHTRTRGQGPRAAFRPLQRGFDCAVKRPAQGCGACRLNPLCSSFKPRISSCQRGRTHFLIRPHARQRFSQARPTLLRREADGTSFG